MRRRRRPAAHVNHERWLVSYADFITLLFAFFVVLYATAQVDKKKMSRLASAIHVAFDELGAFRGSRDGTGQVSPSPSEAPLPVPPPKPSEDRDLSSLRRDLEKALAAEIARKEVIVRVVPEGLVISLREVGFFDSGSAGIQQRSQPALNRMADLLGQGKYHIRIEGHTDNVPIHNSQFASNWELSTARSTEMVRLLITEHQFPPEALSAAGYAEYHPIASNDTLEGRAMNRRVDVVILGRVTPGDTPAPVQDGKEVDPGPK